MGIKVEHQGSATSRIVGANVGGQAASNQQQSLALANKSASENAAANRQLSGAHASGATPGHATAQLGHANASLMSAPEFTPRHEQFKVTKESQGSQSVYNPDTGMYETPWESGEREAMQRENANRIDNSYLEGLLGLKHGFAMEEQAQLTGLRTATGQPQVGSNVMNLQDAYDLSLGTAKQAAANRARSMPFDFGLNFGDYDSHVQNAKMLQTTLPQLTPSPAQPTPSPSFAYDPKARYYGAGSSFGSYEPAAATADDLW